MCPAKACPDCFQQPLSFQTPPFLLPHALVGRTPESKEPATSRYLTWPV